MMKTTNQNQVSTLDQLTKRSVRSFWMDGLWDLVIAGMLLIIAVWGLFYIKFVAFPSWTWPFLQDLGQSIVWMGLLLLVLGLTVYIWIMWIVVKILKNRLIYPFTGFAEHRFFLPIDPKVFGWYVILYFTGLGLLYGLFSWIKGGLNMMSIPFIISPAAILFGVGWFYGIYTPPGVDAVRFPHDIYDYLRDLGCHPELLPPINVGLKNDALTDSMRDQVYAAEKSTYKKYRFPYPPEV